MLMFLAPYNKRKRKDRRSFSLLKAKKGGFFSLSLFPAPSNMEYLPYVPMVSPVPANIPPARSYLDGRRYGTF
jgi:hypothetical protein